MLEGRVLLPGQQCCLLAAPRIVPCRAQRGGVRCEASEPEREPTSSLAAINRPRSAITKSTRRVALGAEAASALLLARPTLAAEEELGREGQVAHSDAEWRKLLTPEQYRVLRQASTEKRFSSPLVQEKRTGTFVCAGCSSPLFSSETKYESGTGWPSFVQAIEGAVEEQPDYSIPYMPRTEVRCKRCQGHLGHVFPDGPQPTGLRYCMNGVALKFEPGSA